MSWTTASTDLRALLSDQDSDRLRYRKRCMGRTNGVNTHFQTLEFRRVTDLTGAAPAGVFVNDVAVTVASDTPDVGEFVLSVAPAVGAEVRATYYYHWFLDTELTQFLQYATDWVGPGIDITLIEPGLRPAVLQYAAAWAYQKMAVRWAENWAMVYKLEDAPKEPEKITAGYNDMAKIMKSDAETNRKQFYSRQDLGEQPLFVFSSGRVRDPMPKR